MTEPDAHTEAPSGEAACPRSAAEASHLEFSQRVLIEYYTHGPLEDLWQGEQLEAFIVIQAGLVTSATAVAGTERASLTAQSVKNLPAMQETGV